MFSLVAVLSPLLGGLIAGLMAKIIGRRGAHWVTVLLLSLSLLCSIALFKIVVLDGVHDNNTLYIWGISGSFQFSLGFLIDALTAVMMVVVTFVSLLVHIYSIGYMADDPGYQRFFSYMSFFTFAMLTLVTANNFLQLFFGWEGVGVVSYLLIGFWFHKEPAAAGSLKAFLVNRIADFAFLLGIGLVLSYVGSLDYHTVFAATGQLSHQSISLISGMPWSVTTVICILFFIGAMGKSAQMPLHIWLPESMEGPTPISALIHAATMVTAGIFMVARLSPLFEHSAVALSVVLIIGATTALFTGLLAFVEYDIKRVIAFSTMSQLGYMMAADGVSAYSAGIFHLLTHAFFKALLFLAAGSVIMALHHEQDMRKMGHLRKYLPMTYLVFLIGALSLSAIPPFSGFYSKDAIIEAVGQSTLVGAEYAYTCLLLGAFVTSYYIFRAFFMTFHAPASKEVAAQPVIKETPWVMQGPLWGLAIPSILAGGLLIYPMLYRHPNLLGSSIVVLPQYDVLYRLSQGFTSAWGMVIDSILTLPFWFSVMGILSAAFMVLWKPKLQDKIAEKLPQLRRVLVRQYGFDTFNHWIFVRGVRALSDFFFYTGDLKVLDHFMVDGTARNVTRMSRLMRRLQSGFLYHYVTVMVIALLVFLIWLLLV